MPSSESAFIPLAKLVPMHILSFLAKQRTTLYGHVNPLYMEISTILISPINLECISAVTMFIPHELLNQCLCLNKKSE